MHALCAHAQGSVDLHVESYGVAGPLVETLYCILDLYNIPLAPCDTAVITVVLRSQLYTS